MRAPRMYFNMAISEINSKNLVDTWLTSCLLSGIDYFYRNHPLGAVLRPISDFEKIGLFDRAILMARNTERKRRLLQSRNFINLLNWLDDARDRPGLFQNTISTNNRLLRLFATISNQQFRFQEQDLPQRLGRTYALLQSIPTSDKATLRKKQGITAFVDLEIVVPQLTGLKVEEFLKVGYYLINFIKHRLENISLRSFNIPLGADKIANATTILTELIEQSKEWYHALSFTVDDLVVIGSDVLSPHNIRNFLNCMTQTTEELRALIKNPEYSTGYLPDMLSPLERYPIVQLSDERYVIPNLRYYDRALTEALHFILQSAFPAPGNRYNQVLGYIQEIYLTRLLQDRLPTLSLIPETAYTVAAGQQEGPDLTLINLSEQSMMLIESKAKRVKISSRVSPTSASLIEDLQVAFKAFDKLPQKVEALRAGHTAYANAQPHINAVTEVPIGVVVMGGGVYFMSELLYDYLLNNPTASLNTYPFPYCLLDLEDFEQAVEIASTGTITLYQLLKEHWQISTHQITTNLMAEAFGNRPTNSNRFIDQYVNALDLTSLPALD